MRWRRSDAVSASRQTDAGARAGASARSRSSGGEDLVPEAAVAVAGSRATRRGIGAWRNKDYRRLWRASAISMFGSEIGELALPLLAIITLSASAAEVGALRAAQFVPFLIATLPLGVFVERQAKRRLLIGADIGRFMLVGTIPVVVWLGADITPVYGLVLAVGCLTVLYQLADFAFLPAIVERGELVDANGKLAAAASANEIAGKGIGGLLVGALTAPVAVIVDAISYLLSAVNLSRIETSEPIQIGPERRPVMREAREGVTTAVRNPFIRPLLAEATTWNLCNEVFILGLLLHAVRGLDLGANVIGLAFVAGGAGSFVGAWWGSRLTGRFGYGRVLLVTLIFGNSAPMFVVFLGDRPVRAVLVLAAIFALSGLGSGVANVHAVSLRQTAIPDSMISRVNAAYRLISWGAVPVGAAAGGVVAAQLGAYPTMVAGAIGVALSTVPVALSRVPRLSSVGDAHVEAGTMV
jgi:Transmembrane secretion effector